MKELRDFLVGIAMAVIGGFIFMSNVVVHGMYGGFFTFGSGGMFHTGTSTMAVLVIAMAIALFALVLKPNFITRWILFLLFILFIVSMVLSLNFGFKSMNGATLFLIIALFVVGLGLIFKALLGMNAIEKRELKAQQEKEKKEN